MSAAKKVMEIWNSVQKVRLISSQEDWAQLYLSDRDVRLQLINKIK